MSNPSKDLAKAGDNLVTAAKIVSGTVLGKRSLSRMTQDSIFQFPMIASASIATDELITMSQSFERQWATMLVSAISLDNKIDMERYGSIGEYLKKFHNNKTAVLPSFLSMLRLAQTDAPKGPLSANEGYGYPEEEIKMGPSSLRQLAMDCWNDDMKIATESLNSLYQPYNRTVRKIEDRLQKMTPASEGRFVDQVKGAKDDAVSALISDDSVINNLASLQNKNVKATINKPTVVKNAKGEKVVTGISGGNDMTKVKPSIANMQKLSSMEPTLVEVPFVCIDRQKGGGIVQWVQTVVIGVKNMIRPVRSDVMIANMIDCVRSGNKVFQFIKWTRGELKIADYLIGISASKEVAQAEGMNRYLKALRRRKLVNNVTKIVGDAVPPNTTIIITKYEAEAIKQQTGVDLEDVYYASKVIKEYYLLAFAIYDTEEKTVNVLFDGDSDWALSNISQLRTNLTKTQEITNAAKMLGMMGRS